MEALPEVKLDTTMSELYAQDRPKDDNGIIGQVLFGPNSEIAPTTRFQRNSKYLYQDPVYSKLQEAKSSDERMKIQRTVAIEYLTLILERDAFMAGPMPLQTRGREDSRSSRPRAAAEDQLLLRSSSH